jgi:hypothetical protein
MNWVIETLQNGAKKIKRFIASDQDDLRSSNHLSDWGQAGQQINCLTIWCTILVHDCLLWSILLDFCQFLSFLVNSVFWVHFCQFLSILLEFWSILLNALHVGQFWSVFAAYLLKAELSASTKHLCFHDTLSLAQSKKILADYSTFKGVFYIFVYQKRSCFEILSLSRTVLLSRCAEIE